MFDFSNRVSLVTGASGALGGVVLRQLVAAGGRAGAADRSVERLAASISDLTRNPDAVSLHACDLAIPGDVERVVTEVFERFGRLDHVFNIAGAFRGGETVEATSEETWELMLSANFRSTLNVCRAVMPIFKRQGAGTIVNVGSRAALAADAGVAAYSITKTAVLRLTESLAAEGKRHGVRVNCVLPGTIDTPANRQAMPEADVSTWVAPEALADVMLFLSAPQSRSVHGAAVPVFGLG